MNAAKSLSASPLGVPAGPWRWAALGFVLLALAAAGLTIAMPQVAGLAGFALLGGVAVLALLFLFAVWPRGSRATQDALRIAEAAGRQDQAAMRHSLLLLRSELDRLKRHAGELKNV